MTSKLNVSCIIDIEAFILNARKIIYRQLAWIDLNSDKRGLVDIYTPGIKYYNLSKEEQQTIRYCTKQIHGLYLSDKKPRGSNNWVSVHDLGNFLRDLGKKYTGTFLYKGGKLERDILKKLGIDGYNLEKVGVPKARDINIDNLICPIHGLECFSFHCPLIEIIKYKHYIITNNVVFL